MNEKFVKKESIWKVKTLNSAKIKLIESIIEWTKTHIIMITIKSFKNLFANK